MNPYYRVTSFEGYSIVKDFYSDRPEREDYLPVKNEYSRTLYWNPNIKLDEKGKADIYFHNNAFCQKIQISAEGMTEKGIPIVNGNKIHQKLNR